jgi:hypothetical protein
MISLVLMAVYEPLHAEEGEQITGVVRVAGGGFSQEIQVLQEGQDTPLVLCDTPEAGRVKKLAAMTVKVTGSWQLNKQGQKSCFTTKSFVVTKHISGREPLVGTLVKNNESFAIKDEGGKEFKLTEVSSGLAKLVGKKVIVDAKSINTSNKKVLKVVSYGEFP